jgi:hypothetical protein
MTNVEFHVATWRKSSHSGTEGAECVEIAEMWRKSSHSGGEGQECVEIAALRTPRMVGMRDSKDPDGPVLAFTTSEWARFLAHVKGYQQDGSELVSL